MPVRDLRYPIGPFSLPPQLSAEDSTAAIDAVAETPCAAERRRQSYRPTARHTLPARWVDGPSTRAPHTGQPFECVRPHETHGDVKTNRRYVHTTKTDGRTCRTRRAGSTCPSNYSKRSTSDGSRSCVRSRRRRGADCCITRRSARSGWTNCWPCMGGTALIMSRTSTVCAAGRAGRASRINS